MRSRPVGQQPESGRKREIQERWVCGIELAHAQRRPMAAEMRRTNKLQNVGWARELQDAQEGCSGKGGGNETHENIR